MSIENQMRVSVVGMGPVGSTLAAHLIEAGAFVVPCDILHDKIDKIKEDGIRLEYTIQKHVKVEEACYSIEELKKYDLDLIVISVKTPNLGKVLELASDLASEKLYVMSAQNGIDNEVEVAKFFGEEKTLRMVINYAGNMIDLNTVHVSFFNPPNYVASLMPRGEEIAKKFAEMLNSVGLTTEIPDDIQDYVWEKAILNAALSAICAITHRTMKEVMDFPQTVELVEAIIDESVHVAEKEGIDLGENFRHFCIQYLKNAGHHKPSMLVDIENGLLTEIDSLNGKIVDYGRKHNIPTPINFCVTALIHLLEHYME